MYRLLGSLTLLLVFTMVHAQNSNPAFVSQKYFIKLNKSKQLNQTIQDAIAHFDGQRFEQALLLLDSALINAKDPSLKATLYYYRANTYTKLNESIFAIQDYQTALQLGNKSDVILYYLAYNHYQLKQYDQAIIYYEAYEDRVGPTSDVCIKLGFLYSGNESYEKAINMYNQAIEINPSLKEAYFLRGQIYLNVLQREKACIDFIRADQLGHEKSYRFIQKYCE